MKKNKFIDKCKSWLLTLGVASVFGLAALGVNATNSYQKASAYQYHDNGVLEFFNNNYDVNIFCSYYLNQYIDGNYEGSHSFDCYFETKNTSDEVVYIIDCVIETNAYESTFTYSVIFQVEGGAGVYFAQDEPGSMFYQDDSDGINFTGYGFTTRPSYEGYQSLRNYALSYNAPQSSGNFITALTDFMSLLGGAIVQLATPVASGVTSFASALFIDNSHLSIMGGIIGIFCGIALAVGITSKVYAWVSTLGN